MVIKSLFSPQTLVFKLEATCRFKHSDKCPLCGARYHEIVVFADVSEILQFRFGKVVKHGLC